MAEATEAAHHTSEQRLTPCRGMTLRRLMKRLASVKAEEEELQAGGDTAGAAETVQVTTLT